jgi:hypothetical protein
VGTPSRPAQLYIQSDGHLHCNFSLLGEGRYSKVSLECSRGCGKVPTCTGGEHNASLCLSCTAILVPSRRGIETARQPKLREHQRGCGRKHTKVSEPSFTVISRSLPARCRRAFLHCNFSPLEEDRDDKAAKDSKLLRRLWKGVLPKPCCSLLHEQQF